MKNKFTQAKALILYCLFLTVLCTLHSTKAQSQNITYLDFETNVFKAYSDTTWKPALWWKYRRVGEEGAACKDSTFPNALTTIDLSTDVARAGSKSGLCILDVRNGGIGHKAMFRNDFIEAGTWPQLTRRELWWKFSFYLPDTGALAWVSDSQPEALFQLYKDEINSVGDAAGPEMALACVNDVFTLDYKFSDLPPYATDPPLNANVKTRTAWTGSVAKGVWVDWVFHMKYSPLTPHGILEVWKQEGGAGYVKIVNIHSERIGFPSDLETKLDLGIYKWPWKCPLPNPVKVRAVYYDEFAKGDSTASFEAMTGVPEPNPDFTAGNLAILRYGNGITSLGSSQTVPVYIDEYTPAGQLVKSIEMPNLPNGANRRLTAIGSATTEGLTTLSPDGQYLAVVGYDADPYTKLDSLTTKDRVVGIVQGNRSVNTSTTLPVSSARIRNAVTSDGNKIWVLGNNPTNGLYYTTLGSSSPVALTIATAARCVQIADNKLFRATGGLPLQIITDPVTGGLPESGTPTVTASNLAANANQFAIFDVDPSIPGPDLIYAASDAVGAVHKYAYNGSAWVAKGSITVAGVTPNIKSITGSIEDSVVTLYAVSIGNSSSVPATPSAMFRVVDSNFTSNLTTTPPSITTLVTAPAKTIFKSVTFAPSEAPAPMIAAPVIANAPVSANNNALNEEKNNKLLLHPNPAGSFVRILHPAGTYNNSWNITSLSGQVLLQGRLAQGATGTTISINSLPKGVYLVVIQQGQEKRTIKLIKQ